MFTDLFRLGSRFELAIPAEIGTVLRALATLEGTLTELDPAFDIAAEARQYAAAHVTEQLSPAAVQKTAADELLALLPMLRRHHAGSTASPALWNKAGSACTCGCSPMNATAG